MWHSKEVEGRCHSVEAHYHPKPGNDALGRGPLTMEHILFQIKPNDPITFAAAATTLLAAAGLAGYGPAWRASRIDPWTALREE